MKTEAWVDLLQLHHPFGISRGTTSEMPVFFVELEGGGIGEGSPVRYHGEKAEEGVRLVQQMAEPVTEENLFDLSEHMQRAREIAPNHSSARAAFDIALHDRIGHQLAMPLHRYFGLPPARNVSSTFTISLDSDDKMVKKTLEAAPFPALKVKLGRDAAIDGATLRAVREAAPDKIIRIDANAGWSLADAREMLPVAVDLGIEFIEQPLAIGNLEELAILKRESPLPIVADEDVQDASSLPRLLGLVDGINIKLMKCGGLWEARRMMAFAQTVGWQVMLGCMIESSIGIAAASHLAGAADSFDLDSEWLISNNPAGPNVLNGEGLLNTPDGPGLGVGWLG
ncbi:dipeptide epimerase [bacterium]|nr:dipeptide epimerase [bacterium]